VVGLSTLSPVQLRDRNPSRHILAVRTQLYTLDKAIAHHSINLPRLLQIAKGFLGPKVGRSSWAGPASSAKQSQRPTWTAIATPRLSSRMARQSNRSRATVHPIYRPLPSPPYRDIRSLVPSYILPRFKAPIVPGAHMCTDTQQVNTPTDSQAVLTAPISPESHRASVAQSVALNAVVQTLASDLLNFSRTPRRLPSLHIQQSKLRRTTTVAPFDRSHAGDGQFGGTARIVGTPTMAISTATQSQSATISRPKATWSNPRGVQDGNGKGNKAKRADLYLEVAILGRWLTQHLDREIIRPRAGIMAIDPRLTPPWGGPSLAT
jgi:hypothetical protein